MRNKNGWFTLCEPAIFLIDNFEEVLNFLEVVAF